MKPGVAGLAVVAMTLEVGTGAFDSTVLGSAQRAVSRRRRSGEKNAIIPKIWPGPMLLPISTSSIRPGDLRTRL